MKKVTSSWKLWALMVGIMVIGAMALGLSGGGQHYPGGIVALYEPGQNIYLDNNYSVFGKETGGTSRAMLTMTTSDNTRLNTGPGKDIIFTVYGAEMMRLTSIGNLVLNNDHSVYGKDTGGIARAMLTLTNTDNTRLNTGPTKDIIFTVGGTEMMRIRSDGKVGVGTTNPWGKLAAETAAGTGVYGASGSGTGVWGLSGDSTGVYGSSYHGNGVYGYSIDSRGVFGFSGSGNGVYGQSTSGYAGYFQGPVRVTTDLNVIGTIYKGNDQFKIDHPLDPGNKYLSHSVVESPDIKNIYDGNIILDEKGGALVEMPSYFESLNRDFRYQLTAVGAPGPNLYIAQKISGNQFKIAGGTPNMEVSWQVTGIRKDAYANAHPIKVEEDKPANEKGLYLHPKELGQPEEKGINQPPVSPK